MQLREGERTLKVYHHHPTPFVFDIVKVIIGAIPFVFILFLFRPIMSTKLVVISHLIVLFIFSLIIVYVSMIYWLDKLIITDQRIIHINWKYLTVRDESEAVLTDIQDVKTYEKGILSHFRAFDYGILKMDTSSSSVTLEFLNCPDPEGIRQFIYHLRSQ